MCDCIKKQIVIDSYFGRQTAQIIYAVTEVSEKSEGEWKYFSIKPIVTKEKDPWTFECMFDFYRNILEKTHMFGGFHSFEDLFDANFNFQVMEIDMDFGNTEKNRYTQIHGVSVKPGEVKKAKTLGPMKGDTCCTTFRNSHKLYVTRKESYYRWQVNLESEGTELVVL